jgi:hypothetical protein
MKFGVSPDSYQGLWNQTNTWHEVTGRNKMLYLYSMARPLLYSRSLAFCFGIFLPLMETIRRWKQLTDLTYFLNWFDDYLLGGFLLFAAFKVLKHKEKGRVYLAAAWGVSVGALFLSTLAQLDYLKKGKADPAPVSSEMVLAIKIFFLLLSVAGMVLCFVRKRE